MSTVKTIGVIHPSGAVYNLTNDTSGNVAVGNNMTVAGTLTANSIVGGGGLTLLATLTTTSGTTQAATSLPTTYTQWLIVFDNIKNSASAGNNQALALALSVNNGSTYGTPVIASANYDGTYFLSGQCEIYKTSTASAGNVYAAMVGTTSLGMATFGPYAIKTASAAPNAIQFSWSSSLSFVAGTISIYGVK